MQLYEYKDEFGNTEVRTKSGTAIPLDMLERWKKMREELVIEDLRLDHIRRILDAEIERINANK
jgi:hypothetical protein